MADDSPYTKREMDEKWNDIRESLGRIEAQTSKTNGRVTALERGQWLAIGAIGVLTPIVLGLSTYILVQVSEFKTTIRSEARSVFDDAIKAYTVEEVK